MKRSEPRAQPILFVASLSLPSARQLAAEAARRRWRVRALDEEPVPPDPSPSPSPSPSPAPASAVGPRTFFGGTDRAAEYAQRLRLCLIEPSLDLLARVPPDLLCRRVRFGTLASLAGAAGPVFVKPADPIDRRFDAGVYRHAADVRGRSPVPADTPVLASDPVEWSAEFRCFVLGGRVAAWSPYLSFGRPVWKPGSAAAAPPPASVLAFCDRLVGRMGDALPPAYVVDVGVLDDGRWAVVEFNPAWCSGLLGADAQRALGAVERAALGTEHARREDLRWARLNRPAAS